MEADHLKTKVKEISWLLLKDFYSKSFFFLYVLIYLTVEIITINPIT